MLATKTQPLQLDRIITGDCLSVMASLPPASVDLVFADPPYNLQLAKTLHRPDQSRVKGVEEDWDKFDGGGEEYDAFTRAWLAAAQRVLKPNGALWVIGSYHNIYRMGYLMAELGFWTLNDVIWRKPNAMPNFRGTRLQNQTEILLWASMDRKAKYTFNYQALKHFNDDKQLGNVWDIPICRGPERLLANDETLHPTQKPEALLYRVLLTSTNAGDVVLDPFFGTGTTGAVAKKLGRRWIGIEQDESYVHYAQKRLDAITAVDDTLLSTPSKRKEVRVAFGEVLAAGLIQPGAKVTNPRGNYTAVVQSDASLIGQDGQRGSIHKLGALVQKAVSCNGWDYWHLDGKPIDAIRTAYRTQLAANNE